MVLSAMGLKLGVFADHTRKNKCKQMHSQASRAVQHFTHVYLHAQTAIDGGDIRT